MDNRINEIRRKISALRLEMARVEVSVRDLVNSDHLRERGFWDPHAAGVLPALPWHASFGRKSGPAPELGADTDAVLTEVLDLSPDEISALRRLGALG